MTLNIHCYRVGAVHKTYPLATTSAEAGIGPSKAYGFLADDIWVTVKELRLSHLNGYIYI